jgi:lysophospholipase
MVGNCIAPAMCVGSGLTGDMMTRDPAMHSQSDADPYIRGTGTPRWFVQTLAMQKRLPEIAPRFRLPLLTLIGSDDVIANNSITQQFFNLVGSTDRTMKTYTPFRHELLRELDRQVVFDDILNWLQDRSAGSVGS